MEIYDGTRGLYWESQAIQFIQFKRLIRSDPIGFFCLVNKDRDKVKLLTIDEQMGAFASKPKIKEVTLEDYEYIDWRP